MMKIAFVHQPWNRIAPKNPVGSTPIWTSHVCQRIRRNHQVYVYSRLHRGLSAFERVDNVDYIRIAPPLDRWIDVAGRVVFTVLHGRRRPWMSSSLFCLQYYARVALDMKGKGIEVVHIHSFPQAAAI